MLATRREFMGGAAATAASFVSGCSFFMGNGGVQWYKGMLHAHTCWSDGRALPEQAVKAYKDAGYSFFAITDHNRIGADPDRWMPVGALSRGWPPKTIEQSVFDAFRAAFPNARWRVRNGALEVRVTPISELHGMFNEDGRFLLMTGCEVTTRLVGPDGGRRQIHMNYVGLDGLLPRSLKASLIENVSGGSISRILRETKDQVDALAVRSEVPHIFFVNHPQWEYYDVAAQDLIDNPDVRFFEVCNCGSYPKDPSMPNDSYYCERLWDVVNAVRCVRGQRLLYGIGSDDTHWYPGSGTSHAPIYFGDAWICVRADSLSAASIFAAMDAGDFYASSGVGFEDVTFDPSNGTLTVAVAPKSGVSHVVEFVTTVRGAGTDVERTVTCPAKGERPARTVSIYSKEVGRTVKSVSFAAGERAFASYTMSRDDLYVRARVVSSEPAVYLKNDVEHPKVRMGWTQPFGNSNLPI